MSSNAPAKHRAARFFPARWSVRAGLVVFGLSVGAYLAGFFVFADHVAQLRAPASLQAADGIVVLTGGQSRMDAGLDLLKAGKGKRLLISGVNPVAGRDDLRLATGGDQNLFSCCVDIDKVALDTIGNAQESAKWVSANTFGSIIVVTNNYHIPRTLLEMRGILPNARLQPYPVVNAPLDNGAWLTEADAMRVLLTEYTKYLAALARHLLSVSETPNTFHSAVASKQDG